jgi:aspartyl-tRNA(Asn)/glutamyl-tRNA(Gln) amidotransferase subunit A
MAGEDCAPVEATSLVGLRLGIPQGFPLDGLDDTVATHFSAALGALSGAGVRLSDERPACLDGMLRVNAKGGFVLPEAYAIHRHMLDKRAEDYDPNVAARIARGRDITGADYVSMSRERVTLLRQMDRFLEEFDALLLPTTPIVAPKISEVATREGFHSRNMLVLRNTSIINFFDLCAISLPLPVAGALPVGLMLVARNGADRRLAAAVERLLAA